MNERLTAAKLSITIAKRSHRVAVMFITIMLLFNAFGYSDQRNDTELRRIIDAVCLSDSKIHSGKGALVYELVTYTRKDKHLVGKQDISSDGEHVKPVVKDKKYIDFLFCGEKKSFFSYQTSDKSEKPVDTWCYDLVNTYILKYLESGSGLSVPSGMVFNGEKYYIYDKDIAVVIREGRLLKSALSGEVNGIKTEFIGDLKRVVIDGIECIELIMKEVHPNNYQKYTYYYVAPSLKYRIIKIIFKNSEDGDTNWEYSIKYTEYEDGLLFPSFLHKKKHTKGSDTPQFEMKFRILGQVELNKQIDDSHFKIEFPEDIHVYYESADTVNE